MKYVIVLGDGMADEPLEQLGNLTPLEYANTPMLDKLAEVSEIGLCSTIPEGMSPGSDTANLSVLGYDPKKYYTGRSPLEALSIGVDLSDTDIALRCNIVSLSDDNLPYEKKVIIDHSSSEIETKDAKILLDAVREVLADEEYQYYLGTSYRHLTIWANGNVIPLVPPHDILGKEIEKYLPEQEVLKNMMKKSYEILNNHPINIERERKGLNKGNSIWFWGAGTKPILDDFNNKFNKTGVMISAVDLLKGIGVGANMKVLQVEGADGTLHTNYEGKAMTAVRSLTEDGYDFAYIHVEAPDEMGHQGNVENKVKAIEYLDERVIKHVVDELEKRNTEYRMLIMPDHPTPIHLRTHTSNPVPYLLYDSTKPISSVYKYTEEDGLKSGNLVDEGYKMILKLFEQ